MSLMYRSGSRLRQNPTPLLPAHSVCLSSPAFSSSSASPYRPRPTGSSFIWSPRLVGDFQFIMHPGSDESLHYGSGPHALVNYAVYYNFQSTPVTECHVFSNTTKTSMKIGQSSIPASLIISLTCFFSRFLLTWFWSKLPFLYIFLFYCLHNVLYQL